MTDDQTERLEVAKALIVFGTHYRSIYSVPEQTLTQAVAILSRRDELMKKRGAVEVWAHIETWAKKAYDSEDRREAVRILRMDAEKCKTELEREIKEMEARK